MLTRFLHHHNVSTVRATYLDSVDYSLILINSKNKLAGRLRIELRPADLESAMLPLQNTSLKIYFIYDQMGN